ncbi:MAG: hypothetical protein HFI64_13330 [Lachnospiraceae bacterium]|nr:hypothetical protein [Lachnospiraceae bacterium]
MKKYCGLIGTIADEFHISKGESEGEGSWKARVVYSLLGRMGYASLWDIQEDLQPASIIHFKKRIAKLTKSYLEMYPEIRQFYSDDTEGLCNEVYDIFLSTGNVYHSPDRIVPAAECVSEAGGVYFMRGVSLDRKQHVSGIGCYSYDVGDTSPLQVKEMFQLQESTLTEQWEYLISHVKWRPVAVETKVEYHRTKPPFNYGYWIGIPDKTGEISLARTGSSGNWSYYLYKIENERLMGSQLPEWMVREGNYRTVSNGYLSAKNVLPATAYHIDGKIVQVHINYLFPPAELNLVKLYSWPKFYVGLPHDFNRVFEGSVFWAIKAVLESIGYRFKEE